METFARKYFDTLSALIKAIRTTDASGAEMGFYDGIRAAHGLFVSSAGSGNKLIFIGNGASAAIASHISTDLWKNGGIRGVAFNDGSLLTCVSNDCGYEHVFEKPVRMFGDPGDTLVAISSSGQSPNIIRAAQAAREMELRVITLSGFEQDNPLSSLGDLNFYVPEKSYGLVEILHHSICHCIVDAVIHYKTSE